MNGGIIRAILCATRIVFAVAAITCIALAMTAGMLALLAWLFSRLWGMGGGGQLAH